MRSKIFAAATSALLALSVAFGTTAKPAAADQAAVTRNIILGAAAVAIGVTAANVAHKHAVANTVVGYTPDGSTVYQDGHVVSPNGQSYYPGNYGESVSCNGQYCNMSGNGTYNNGYGYNGYGYNGYGYNGYNNNGYNSNGYNGYYNTGYNGNNGYWYDQSHRRH